MSWFWDFIYPPTCIHCGKDVRCSGEWCPSCFAEVYRERTIHLRNSVHLESVYILANYGGGIKTMLHDIKFNGKKERAHGAAPFLQRFSITCSKENYIPTIVVPIPISDSKRESRGYNQVDLLFKSWVHRMDWEWVDGLIKLDGSKPMWGLSKKERAQNMRGQFLIDPSKLDPIKTEITHILLLDDIYTTGATLLEASRILHEYVPQATIKALTLAGGA